MVDLLSVEGFLGPPERPYVHKQVGHKLGSEKVQRGLYVGAPATASWSSRSVNIQRVSRLS
jgi:hypothetical protein